MSREEKINKLLEKIKIRRNDEQYRGGPFPIYHIEFDILNEEIERLNNIIKTKDEGIKAFTEDLCEESTKIEKAIDYINKRKQEREKANRYAYDIRNDDFIKYCNIELDILKGSDKE